MTASSFDNRLVLLIGLAVLGLVLLGLYSSSTILYARQESFRKTAAPTPAPVMQRIMVEPMLPTSPLRPAPVPTPKPKVAAHPASIDTEHALIAGRAMRDGNTPNFIGKIDLPFDDYLVTMEQLGCRLVGYDVAAQQVVANFHAGQLTQKPLGGGKSFSSQARDVTLDMPRETRDKYLTLLREKSGPGSYSLILVFPGDLQARFKGSLAIMAQRAGFTPTQIDSIEYRFSKMGGNLVLHLDSVKHKNTTSKTFEATKFAAIHGAS